MSSSSTDNSLPYFLQTSEGKVSLPALLGLIVSTMIAAVVLTITVYVVVVRRFHAYFEAKERVGGGQHMSFLEAASHERASSESSSSSTSSSRTSSPITKDFDESDFEDVSSICSPVVNTTTTNNKKFVPSNSMDKFSYSSSAREVSV